MDSIFSGLITSKIRIRILMRLFLNPHQNAYLRELADEFMVSPSQVRGELQHLSRAGILASRKNGRQIHYQANRKHPLFNELHAMVKKAFGMDQILERIVQRLGEVEKAYLLDDYAAGRDSGIIDLALVGRVRQESLIDLVAETESYIDRKIRTLVLSVQEWQELLPSLVQRQRPLFLLWDKESKASQSTASALLSACSHT